MSCVSHDRASSLFADPNESPSIEKILEACASHPAYVDPLSMDVRVVSPGENTDTYNLRAQRTGDVIDVRASRVVVDEEGKELSEMGLAIRERAVGEIHMRRQEPRGEDDPDVIIHDEVGDGVDRILFDWRFGWLLDGYFFGMDQRSVVQLLDDADEREMVIVDDSSIIYIKARTSRHGLVEAWFDAEHDFLLRKYRLSKEHDDLLDGTPLKDLPRPDDVPPTITWVAETSQFDVEVIDGIALPVSGTLDLTLTHADGSSRVLRKEVSRDEVEFSVDPELKELSSLIPEGRE